MSMSLQSSDNQARSDHNHETDPTPDEIREHCRIIRNEWNETTLRRRCRRLSSPWSVPEARNVLPIHVE